MAEYIEREALWRAFEYEPFYDNADRDEIVLPKIDDFPASDVVEVGKCEGCAYGHGKRPQKCACCRRNRYLKDCYERRVDNG